MAYWQKKHKVHKVNHLKIEVHKAVRISKNIVTSIQPVLLQGNKVVFLWPKYISNSLVNLVQKPLCLRGENLMEMWIYRKSFGERLFFYQNHKISLAFFSETVA